MLKDRTRSSMSCNSSNESEFTSCLILLNTPSTSREYDDADSESDASRFFVLSLMLSSLFEADVALDIVIVAGSSPPLSPPPRAAGNLDEASNCRCCSSAITICVTPLLRLLLLSLFLVICPRSVLVFSSILGNDDGGRFAPVWLVLLRTTTKRKPAAVLQFLVVPSVGFMYLGTSKFQRTFLITFNSRVVMVRE